MYFGKSESSILQLLKIIISAFLNQKISKPVNAAMNILLKFYNESNDKRIQRLKQKPEIRKSNKSNKLKKNAESCTTTYMIRKNDRSYWFTHGLGVCNVNETHCFNYDACTCLKRQMKGQRQNKKKDCLDSFDDKTEEVKTSNSQKEESIYDRIENHFSKLRSTKEAEDHRKTNQDFIGIIDVRCDQNERDPTRKKAAQLQRACAYTRVYSGQLQHSTADIKKVENLILKLNRICRLINYLNASLQNIKSIVIKIIKIISKEMQICKASCGI